MAISVEEVRHVAALCRLALPAAEEAALTEQLGRILDHVRRLQACDVTDVPPTAHVGGGLTLRPDEVRPSLAQEVAVANAPAARAGLFLVPRVVEEGSA
jgi:aspartyl-tRNA(Asn)/glutamyl-tRNA(Gln) amidotransferase subunit C